MVLRCRTSSSQPRRPDVARARSQPPPRLADPAALDGAEIIRRLFLLTIERNRRYASFVYRKERRGERKRRHPARDPRHVGAQGAAARADAWLGYYRTHRTMVRERASVGAGHAVSRALPPRTSGPDSIRVEGHGEQSPRTVLLVDPPRPSAFQRRTGAVAAHLPRRQPGARGDH